MAKKKKQIAKKKSQKKVAKKKKKAAKKSPSSKKAFSSGSYSSSFPSSISGQSSFLRNSYKTHGLDKRSTRFNRQRLVLLVLGLGIIIILAIWSSSSTKNETLLDDLSEPKAQKLNPLEDEENETIKKGEESLPEEGDPAPTQPQESPSEASSPSPSESFYTVKPGDNLSKVAREILGDPSRYQEIMSLNGMSSPNQIKVGQKLKIPAK